MTGRWGLTCLSDISILEVTNLEEDVRRLCDHLQAAALPSLRRLSLSALFAPGLVAFFRSTSLLSCRCALEPLALSYLGAFGQSVLVFFFAALSHVLRST